MKELSVSYKCKIVMIFLFVIKSRKHNLCNIITHFLMSKFIHEIGHDIFPTDVSINIYEPP